MLKGKATTFNNEKEKQQASNEFFLKSNIFHCKTALFHNCVLSTNLSVKILVFLLNNSDGYWW